MSDWVDGLSPDERESWDAFVEHFRRSTMERMTGSSAFVSLVPGQTDAVKFAAELGAAIILDKPILAVVTPGAAVSEPLERVSDRIIEADADTHRGQQKIADEIAEFIKG